MAPGRLLPADDVIMEDAPSSPHPVEGNGTAPISSQPTIESPAPAVRDPASDGSDKENEQKRSLEDIFDDDVDDEEFASSLAQLSQQPDLHTNLQTAHPTDPEILRAFYARLFPFRPIFQWLNHSPAPREDFLHREFALTLSNDAYLRYQSYASADVMRAEFVKTLPKRFEIGPVYSTNPRERKRFANSRAGRFRPVQKELVFDVDLTDYDDVRTCCEGAKICERCWAWIRMAVKVLDAALREDFGFKHVLWVYSGRRGIHAWVCDKRARSLDDGRRKAIAGYLELLKGGDKGGKKVNVKRPLHPHLERSLRILRSHFQHDILDSQDPFLSDAQSETLLSLLPDKGLASALQKRWAASPERSSASKWADIDELAASGVSASLDPRALKEAKQDIVLEYTYPRLDAEVSKKLNHLLKSPFCVHPATGRICVPVDVRSLDEFDPEEVPTLVGCLDEIDRWEGPEEARKVSDWEKTSLKPYVEYFKGFVAALMKEEKFGKVKEENGDSMEF